MQSKAQPIWQWLFCSECPLPIHFREKSHASNIHPTDNFNFLCPSIEQHPTSPASTWQHGISASSGCGLGHFPPRAAAKSPFAAEPHLTTGALSPVSHTRPEVANSWSTPFLTKGNRCPVQTVCRTRATANIFPVSLLTWTEAHSIGLLPGTVSGKHI